ncbi:MAG TPA: dTDP-glucose 4,6-dehydratase [Noviherbaspirillum sp.]|jgi:dTDP-glucose 4,6-dehydratase|uniref:dTDP-glucose 4,6-dehydratase n=1 Tax=Noviherbaspirillum sp. TaxID=1926288 RepID=UPI002DDDA75D|nr:dTDP-glucose 4,6-dehydratase [Noviherbaspirillum sp.]HEV2609969.1 dTDP-glucose 4,6-dehydratase [Noviherbaspirillum sp.]
MILVTGGAGFIGANFILDWLAHSDEPVVNIDKLTYSGNIAKLSAVREDARHIFMQADIGDQERMHAVFHTYRPRAVVHFAAESHVDRSIADPAAFIATNVCGTFSLLEAARRYMASLTGEEKNSFRFLHVSTDEVYGSLDPGDPPFNEASPYAPNSPYAASKAASDHLVRAWHHTYGLPMLATHCTNNYGPYQFPEKLIPLTIANALADKPLPLYGDGHNVRDWLYVGDHCAALRSVLAGGVPGATYHIGGNSEKTNLDVVNLLCDLLDRLTPRADGHSYRRQIAFVADRPGHDRRYAVDAGRIAHELGWKPAESFDTGIRKTVEWCLAHPQWLAPAEAVSAEGTGA